MNENPDRPGPDAVPDAVPDVAPDAGPDAMSDAVPTDEATGITGTTTSTTETAGTAPAKKPVRRGRIAALAGCGALLVAVVVGAGFTVVTVDGADRDAGAPVWRFPKASQDERTKKAAEAAAGTKSVSGLASLLVPYAPVTDGYFNADGSGFARGPDIDEFGSDSEFSGRQAAELRKQSIRDLPRSQRLRLEKQIDKEQIKGMAMRSYLSATTLDGTGELFTADIVLSRMDRKAVREIATFQNEFLTALDVFRKGPEIEGHKNAQCFLPPKDAEEELDMMICSAYKGDVMVSATAYGAKPLNTKGAAALLREQLDRIAEPGEAV